MVTMATTDDATTLADDLGALGAMACPRADNAVTIATDALLSTLGVAKEDNTDCWLQQLPAWFYHEQCHVQQNAIVRC